MSSQPTGRSKADLLLHPVRMKIIQTLIGRQLTIQQMGERLTDIPQATLYRHMKLLLQSGLLKVVEEHPIRGTTERVFALAEQGESLTKDDLLHASREEHMQYFMHFMAMILGDFGTYLQRDSIDLQKDLVAYRQAGFFASDEEVQELLRKLGAAISEVMSNDPAPNRTKRTLTSILLPDTPRS